MSAVMGVIEWGWISTASVVATVATVTPAVQVTPDFGSGLIRTIEQWGLLATGLGLLGAKALELWKGYRKINDESVTGKYDKSIQEIADLKSEIIATKDETARDLKDLAEKHAASLIRQSDDHARHAKALEDQIAAQNASIAFYQAANVRQREMLEANSRATNANLARSIESKAPISPQVEVIAMGGNVASPTPE